MNNDNAEMGRWWRALFLDLLPIGTIIILIAVIAIPLQTIGTVRLGGLWPLIGITYWTLVRPRAMGPILVFMFGLLTDLISFSPVGLHAFVFVLAQAVLKRQRRFLVGQGFWVLWAAFAVLALVATSLLAFLASLVQHHAVMLWPLMGSVALACGILPLLLWLLDRVHQLMDMFDEPV